MYYNTNRSLQQCNFNCFLTWRNIDDYLEGVAYYIDKGKLYACEIPKEYSKTFKKAGLKETSSELTALNILKI